MVVTLLGMVMLVKPAEENASFPIVVSEAGRLMLLRALHPLKARTPIDVTLAGMVMLDKERQSANI